MAAILIVGNGLPPAQHASANVVRVAEAPQQADASWVGKFAAIVDSATAPRLGEATLQEYARCLVPGGELSFVEPLQSDAETRLLMAGFVDVQSIALAAGNRKVTAKKPAWDGAAQKLSFGVTKKVATATAWKLDDDDLLEAEFKAPLPVKSDVWRVQLDDDGGELEDENALLSAVSTVDQPSELAKLVAAGAGGEDCSTTKKACTNCVCGRGGAEAEATATDAKSKLLQMGAAQQEGGRLVVDTGKLASSAGGCNSCALGDAFRCKGCPSRGLPAYSVGEKIVIGLE